jgi:hypothetical protein
MGSSVLLPVAAALACGCSSGATTAAAGDGGVLSFPLDAYATATSASGDLVVEVRTAPAQPPPRGTCEVELRVIDHDGHAVDGLALSVVPWMPAMGHGASVVPSVTAIGDGRYVADNVSFYMPGAWQLRVTIGGARSDDATAIVEVP